MRTSPLLNKYRGSINPPYKKRDFIIIGLTLFVLLAIPLTVLLANQARSPRSRAAGGASNLAVAGCGIYDGGTPVSGRDVVNAAGGPAPLPNMLCTHNKNGTLQDRFVAGDTAILGVVISNNGTLTTFPTNFWIDIWNGIPPTYIKGCNNPGAVKSYFFSNPSPSNPTSLNFNFPLPTQPGTYVGSLIVDSRGSLTSPFQCSIPGYLATNNWGVFQYTIVDPNIDSDGDGFTNRREVYIGTDPFQRCGVDAWPADFNNDHVLNIIDIQSLAYRVGAKPGNSLYSQRYDLNADGVIDQNDLNLLINLTAPMFGGQKVLGRTCTPL